MHCTSLGKWGVCGGEFVGYCDGGRTKTVLCFMNSSVCGGYRVVVRLSRLLLTSDPSEFVYIIFACVVGLHSPLLDHPPRFPPLSLFLKPALAMFCHYATNYHGWTISFSNIL